VAHLPDIKSLTQAQLADHFKAWDQPNYRVSQLLDWLYARRATSFEEMSNLPKTLRAQLAEHFALRTLTLVIRQGAADETCKFLWRLGDGALIESVVIPANPALYGETSDRRTLCVSTQVGCAYGCRFCASGLEGWRRNLTTDEIVEQCLAAERWYETDATQSERAPGAGAVESSPGRGPEKDRWINNLVIMGMGEPLANYANLLQALRILNAPWGGGIGARKITISTSGLAPQIRQLAAEPHQFRLAISLHGATDVVRNQIMPINRKYPLRELISACEEYVSRQERMITFEYLLLAGVNDGLDQVMPLVDLARRVRARINLIAYNPVVGLPYERPTEAVQNAFLQAVEKQGIAATLRREKGGDIDAACGQLRLKAERQGANSVGNPLGNP